ncbi:MULTISPECIES: DUF1802 family protein [unclassified Paenibacillus]|uniref:DUF1802 family protein n=1 Tax=unclassified Paenibacillus TaxID=185978 RepID=UPI001C104D1A|nr:MULTISPECIES: DUF1802 family protein [unclassified Paenibacillus]MBU5441547.1 DUF1802 family protein [Paenibacillus sp. MSJ-34]CAH0117786.1 hypothetical protein PAE9249_00247 [Paenibacillus sp. CECT 9249]
MAHLSQTGQAVALKEWAVAVQALLDGRQTIVMRKGGIVEETKHFELKSHSFYLYPTYEHQRKHLLKDTYQHVLNETLADWSPNDSSVTIAAYAEAVRDIEIRDQETLDRLRHLHIWTDRFAEERLKWKRKHPLHVIVLRVYRLQDPLEIPIVPEHLGCKSWVGLDAGNSASGMSPVIGDREFEIQLEQIEKACRSIDLL